jgi:hypothetical protein
MPCGALPKHAAWKWSERTVADTPHWIVATRVFVRQEPDDEEEEDGDDGDNEEIDEDDNEGDEGYSE